MDLIFLFLALASHSPVMAALVFLVFCMGVGYVQSRTLSVTLQLRIVFVSLAILLFFLYFMWPALIDLMPFAKDPSPAASQSHLSAVSFFAILLGMFFFIPISGFLFVSSLFALLFGVRRHRNGVTLAAERSHQPNLEKSRFGRMSK